jgi:adenine C2-methylase RlmN of 23S rRNA A2503 and tRNA A37
MPQGHLSGSLEKILKPYLAKQKGERVETVLKQLLKQVSVSCSSKYGSEMKCLFRQTNSMSVQA